MVTAKILSGLVYRPLLCSKLQNYNFYDLGTAIKERGSFILDIDTDRKLSISWWVSPKRTRSYPYARVYDTIGNQLRKVTIIPILKDEGKEGDRDFIQWDTISLMSLLNIYVMIAYYKNAKKSKKYRNKITKQEFDIDYLKKEIFNLLDYKSCALHWNLAQVDKIPELASIAIKNYRDISKKLGVEMHSDKRLNVLVENILNNKNNFINYSRSLAKKAQIREVSTVQPKEKTEGSKIAITIENYLGGVYYFTCDQAETRNSKLYLIECKHTAYDELPSIGDIKDGLLKIILYKNLEETRIDNNNEVKVRACLRLTSKLIENKDDIKRKKRILNQIIEEAKINNFSIMYNDQFIYDF